MSNLDLTPNKQPLQCSVFPQNDSNLGNTSPSIHFPQTLGSPFINSDSFITSPTSLDKTPKGLKSTQGKEEKAVYSSYTSIMSPHPRSITSASQPTKPFAGSIVIETPVHNRSKKGSIGSFNDVLYDRIDQFLDKEGLDITEATTYVSNFMQIIKLKVVESSGSPDSAGRNTTQLNCLRSQSANTMNMMDVRTSKLFQRRASHSQEPTPRVAFRNNAAYSDDNFVTEESRDNVKNLHNMIKGKEKLSPSFKNKLRTLLSVDNEDLDSEAMGSPCRRLELLSPVSIYGVEGFAQSLEKLSPELPPMTSLKFIPMKDEGMNVRTPLSRSRAALSPTVGRKTLRKGASLCQSDTNGGGLLLSKIY